MHPDGWREEPQLFFAGEQAGRWSSESVMHAAGDATCGAQLML
jgi:hypothetical protein